MRVVSDADVLIHLSKLGKLSLLQSLYKEVALPEHVKWEIITKEDAELQKAFNLTAFSDLCFNNITFKNGPVRLKR